MKNAVILTLTIAWLAAAAYAQSGPAKEPSELKVLAHWQGDRDVVLLVDFIGDPKGKRKIRGSYSAKWVVDGRFLELLETYDSAEKLPDVKTLMTFDPERKIFRAVAFFGNGIINESKGTWDEKTRTMEWTSKDADSGRSSVTRSAFADDGTENWTFVEKDAGGKVVGTIEGKNTLKKK
jgi:hypothetical protein